MAWAAQRGAAARAWLNVGLNFAALTRRLGRVLESTEHRHLLASLVGATASG